MLMDFVQIMDLILDLYMDLMFNLMMDLNMYLMMDLNFWAWILGHVGLDFWTLYGLSKFYDGREPWALYWTLHMDLAKKI